MQLLTLSIRNFRGIRQADISLGLHNVFIGANNCGKTTVIEALALLFGRDRLVRALTEHDFFGGNPVATDRIKLTATIVGFPGNDPAKNTDWFTPDRAVPKWIDPETRQLIPEPRDAKSLLACQIEFAARFDRQNLEIETARYFVDDEDCDVFDEENYHSVPQRLLRELGFFLIPANRAWDRVISFGSELFRRVVSSGDGLPSQSVLAERDRLRAPTEPVENDRQISPIITALNNELHGFFQTVPSLRLRVTSTDSEGVLDALVPHFAHGVDGPVIPARRQGTGLVSLQSLLLLLQLGRRRAEAGQSFWMAMEEPELHIPPPLQRRVVQRLQSLSRQTFISTHSPTVAGMSDPRALAVLRNIDGVLTSTSLDSVKSQASDKNGVRKLFELHRQDTIAALMHDAVLIPEGLTDGELLELLTAAVDAQQTWESDDESRFSAHVGLVRTRDAAVVDTYKRLRSLHPKTLCLVDGDVKGKEYIAGLGALPEPPSRALRWCDDWTIEDVVGWVVDAAPELVNGIEDIAPPIASVQELVARLKSDDRSDGGLKQNRVAYEGVAQAIASTPAARYRARELLNAVTEEALGKRSTLFSDGVEGKANFLVRVFKP
ncbi:ATP-dependent nuclease [Cupriavidus lacunae]|uniref:Chromosome partitioning protein n=1 Tax=Cupriavidus lacunae TaxID=2666307 RepID=A0A370NUA2_9BURK|nr:AAA family ATPase [Cupriavidus lacunae]RDK09180.1 chromosome partitioning protein [Cupriavidus lacunae]